MCGRPFIFIFVALLLTHQSNLYASHEGVINSVETPRSNISSSVTDQIDSQLNQDALQAIRIFVNSESTLNQYKEGYEKLKFTSEHLALLHSILSPTPSETQLEDPAIARLLNRIFFDLSGESQVLDEKDLARLTAEVSRIRNRYKELYQLYQDLAARAESELSENPHLYDQIQERNEELDRKKWRPAPPPEDPLKGLNLTHTPLNLNELNQKENTPESCFANLDANQLGFLGTIDELADNRNTTIEELEKKFQEMEAMKLAPREKRALAGIAASRVLLARQKLVAFDPNGPNRKALEQLRKKGAFKNSKTSLQGLDTHDLKSLKKALQTVYPISQASLEKLPDNKEPIFLGEDVLMPKAFSDPQKIVSLQDFAVGMQGELERFTAGLREDMEEGNEAASGWTYFKQIFTRNESPRAQGEAGYNQLAQNSVNNLEKKYGFSKEKLTTLRNLLINAGTEENKKHADGAFTATLAGAALILSPLSYFYLMYGSTALFLAPMAFTALDVGVTAGIDTAYNGNLTCNLGKQLLEKGPTSFFMSLALQPAGKLLAFGGSAAKSGLSLLFKPQTVAGISKVAVGTAGAVLTVPGIAQIVDGKLTSDKAEGAALKANATGNETLQNEFERQGSQGKANTIMGLLDTVVFPFLGRLATFGKPPNEPEINTEALRRALEKELVSAKLAAARNKADPTLRPIKEIEEEIRRLGPSRPKDPQQGRLKVMRQNLPNSLDIPTNLVIDGRMIPQSKEGALQKAYTQLKSLFGDAVVLKKIREGGPTDGDFIVMDLSKIDDDLHAPLQEVRRLLEDVNQGIGQELEPLKRFANLPLEKHVASNLAEGGRFFGFDQGAPGWTMHTVPLGNSRSLLNVNARPRMSRVVYRKGDPKGEYSSLAFTIDHTDPNNPIVVRREILDQGFDENGNLYVRVHGKDIENGVEKVADETLTCLGCHEAGGRTGSLLAMSTQSLDVLPANHVQALADHVQSLRAK